jgi:hypothetical protein
MRKLGGRHSRTGKGMVSRVQWKGTSGKCKAVSFEVSGW